jgi:superkiller protein 3
LFAEHISKSPDHDIVSSSVRKAFKVVLSTSLVHFFPPKHHPRALRIMDEVLSQDPQNVACLMARGYILEAAAQWTEACECFARVVGLIPDDVDDGLRSGGTSVVSSTDW